MYQNTCKSHSGSLWFIFGPFEVHSPTDQAKTMWFQYDFEEMVAVFSESTLWCQFPFAIVPVVTKILLCSPHLLIAELSHTNWYYRFRKNLFINFGVILAGRKCGVYDVPYFSITFGTFNFFWLFIPERWLAFCTSSSWLSMSLISIYPQTSSWLSTSKEP